MLLPMVGRALTTSRFSSSLAICNWFPRACNWCLRGDQFQKSPYSSMRVTGVTQLPTAVFIAQILIGSEQDFENCLEGVSAPEPCCVDGCSYISLGLGGPHCAVAVGDFPLDHAGSQFSL